MEWEQYRGAARRVFRRVVPIYVLVCLPAFFLAPAQSAIRYAVVLAAAGVALFPLGVWLERISQQDLKRRGIVLEKRRCIVQELFRLAGADRGRPRQPGQTDHGQGGRGQG